MTPSGGAKPRGGLTNRQAKPAASNMPGSPCRDDLYVMPLRVGVALQLKSRVIGDRAAMAQTGGGQEAVDRPCRGVGMLGHRGEDATGDAPDVAGLEMLGEHRRDDPVLGAAANSRGVFGATEDRVSAEEGCGDEPGHGSSGRYFNVIDDSHICIIASGANHKVGCIQHLLL